MTKDKIVSPFPQFEHVFAGHNLDRCSNQRTSSDWLEEQKSRTDAKFLFFKDDKPLILSANNDNKLRQALLLDGVSLHNFQIGNVENSIFLGTDTAGDAENPVPWFALDLGSEFDENGFDVPVVAEDLREMAIHGLLSPLEFARLGLAKSLSGWHQYHSFCSNCGTKTIVEEGGSKRVCPSCKREHFPRVDPVVIMLIYRGEKCLLGCSHNFLPGMYSALAGFVEPGESLSEAVRREIYEESGVKVGSVVHHSDQPWPFPSSLMIGCFGEALSEEITIDDKEIRDARWFDRGELQLMFDKCHPDKLKVPFPHAIAHHLIKSFLEML